MTEQQMTVANPAAIAEFEQRHGDGRLAQKMATTEMAMTREAQEVQTAMIIAKRFPRDPYTAYNKIMSDCQRTSLAEKAIYEYPKGGQTVSGPSIHLARALARNWGNVKSGFKVLDANPKENIVMAYCHDLETNYYEEKIFTVPNVRHTKKGDYPITDPREIYENVANQAARRERSCILSVIPADILDAALGQCQATLQGNSSVPLQDRIRAMINVFADKYGVTAEMLETFMGRKTSAFTMQSVIKLRGVYQALEDGTASVDQYFPESAGKPQQPQQLPEAAEPQAVPETAPQDAATPKQELSLDDF